MRAAASAVTIDIDAHLVTSHTDSKQAAWLELLELELPHFRGQVAAFAVVDGS